MKNSLFIPLIFMFALFSSCTKRAEYSIGVSQCSEDDWRALLNSEIQREARFQGDMQVEVLSANDDSRQQIKDIERFIAQRKDLIIVAPNVAEDVRPVIEKAYDSGIPVILIDRRIKGSKYTAFIGANNTDIGRQIGEFVCLKYKGRSANIIELRGLKGSSPEEERHEGFMSQISKPASQLSIIGDCFCDWNEKEAQLAMDSLLKVHPKIDIVFAHNDRMALGAYNAIKAAGREKEMQIVGVDALLLDGGGVDMVMQRKMLATFIYPTGGSEAIILAKQILQKRDYRKEMELPAALVDEDNARVMKLQYKTMCQQEEKYKKMEKLTDRQLEKINRQEIILIGTILLIVICGIAILTLIKFNREKAQLNDLMMSQIKTLVSQTTNQPSCPSPLLPPEQPDSPEQPVCKEESDSAELPDSTAQSATVFDAAVPNQKSNEEYKTDIKLLNQISDIINRHISDSDFSITDIADELCISRVQLYRRIKAMSDINLTVLIRNARLERARGLLTASNKSISEIAYEVGFSSPSYFTRCFKDYFGISPSEAQENWTS